MTFDPAAAGWKALDNSGFPSLLGPLWAKHEADGWAYGLLAEPGHCNRRNVIHGGVLTALADHALGLVAWEAAGRQPCATIQLDTHFVAAVLPGSFIEGRGQIVRVTRSVTFMRGALTVAGQEVLTANGIWKVLGPGRAGQ
jgi:uncharacterized protein (TIGR00369 family)